MADPDGINLAFKRRQGRIRRQSGHVDLEHFGPSRGLADHHLVALVGGTTDRHVYANIPFRVDLFGQQGRRQFPVNLFEPADL